MTASEKVTAHSFRVGDRVQILLPGGDSVPGRLVDDFAEQLGKTGHVGRTWATPHRWAVALDSGVLRFVDDNDLTAEAPRANASSASSPEAAPSESPSQSPDTD